MKRSMRVVTLCALVVISAGSARGGLTTYIGSDVGANSTDPRPNSNVAAANFDAAVSMLGALNIITFESSPLGHFTSLTVGAGVVISGWGASGTYRSIENVSTGTPDGVYGYNTTSGGANYLNLFGGALTFTFATPTQAFGAYFTGVQKWKDRQTLGVVTFEDGSTQTIEIPSLDGGGVSFVGFADSDKNIVNVAINATSDIIGLDDVRFVTNGGAAVPEPSALVMGLLATGFGLAARARRSRG